MAIHVCSFFASKTEKTPELQVFPDINVTYFFFAIKVKRAVDERFSEKF